MTPADAVANAHEWFHHHSGWAPPDADTLAEWRADGVCRCPDECLVAPDGWCVHGLASWALVLADLDGRDAAARRRRQAGAASGAGSGSGAADSSQVVRQSHQRQTATSETPG